MLVLESTAISYLKPLPVECSMVSLSTPRCEQLAFLLDVYLSLNGDVIPNHGYVIISDIGSTGDTALLCNTNRPPQGLSGGDWFGSDGDRVDSTDVPGFWRNRGPMVVRLLRNTAIEAVEGIYKCVIQDKAHMTCIIYVGLYSDKGI